MSVISIQVDGPESSPRVSRWKPTALVGQESTTVSTERTIWSTGPEDRVTLKLRTRVSWPPLAVPASSWRVTVMLAVPVAPGAGVKVRSPVVLGAEQPIAGVGMMAGLLDAAVLLRVWA